MITYDPFWETLKRKNISIYKLVSPDYYGLSHGTLTSLKQNKSITMATLDNLCNMLDITPDEIIKYTPG